MEHPRDLKYSKSHEWVRVEGDMATVGIPDHAQGELGDVVFVELPDVGRKLQKDEVFGTVESVKAVSDLISPVSGEVVEVNKDLVDSPEMINQEPYGAGWMVVIRMENPGELDSLMSAEEYEAFIQEQ